MTWGAAVGIQGEEQRGRDTTRGGCGADRHVSPALHPASGRQEVCDPVRHTQHSRVLSVFWNICLITFLQKEVMTLQPAVGYHSTAQLPSTSTFGVH